MHPEYQANQQFLLLLLCLACSVLIMLCARENGKAGKQENSPPGRGKLIARGARGSGIRITCVINAHPRACPFPPPHEARSYLWLPALIVGLPFDYRSIFDSIQFDHRNEATSKAAQLIRFPAEQVYGQLYILVIYFPTFDFSPQLRFLTFSWASARFPLFCLWLLKIAESKCKQKRKNTKNENGQAKENLALPSGGSCVRHHVNKFSRCFSQYQALPFSPCASHIHTYIVYTLHTF